MERSKINCTLHALLSFPPFSNSSLLQVQFFAYLTLSKTVSVASFLELLQSFLVVLDEPGVSYERMEAAALCIGDGLLRVRECLFLVVHRVKFHLTADFVGWPSPIRT